MNETGVDDYMDAQDKRIAELEAEHRDCLQTITDMQSKWEALKVENERLTQDRDQLGEWMERGNTHVGELVAENERLREKVKVQGLNLRLREIDGSMDEDAIIKDAERYRWLRDNPEHESLPYYEDGKWHFPYQIYGHAGTGGGVALRSFDTLDAAIDAARGEK